MTRRALLVPGVLLTLSVLAGCGSTADDGGATAADSPSGSMPTANPAAEGEVTTGYALDVVQKGDGAVRVCLGYVAQSLPPQCGGPEVEGWDWSVWQRGQDYRSFGGVRFGTFAVTGTWDGDTLSVTDAVAGRNAPGWNRSKPDAGSRPTVGRDVLRQALHEVEELPGMSVADVRGGRVHVDVTYDNGSIQAWCDQEYGAGVVVVSSELYDVG